MDIPYFHSVEAQDSLTVQEPGQCLIECSNDAGQFWYLYIKSIYGECFIYEFGPTLGDAIDPKSFNFNYYRMPYSDTRLESVLSKFLNNSKRVITQAREITEEENVKDLLPLLSQFIDLDR